MPRWWRDSRWPPRTKWSQHISRRSRRGWRNGKTSTTGWLPGDSNDEETLQHTDCRYLTPFRALVA
ncbi:unnamed protein product [Ectocarpus fasciculatus]